MKTEDVVVDRSVLRGIKRDYRVEIQRTYRVFKSPRESVKELLTNVVFKCTA